MVDTARLQTLWRNSPERLTDVYSEHCARGKALSITDLDLSQICPYRPAHLQLTITSYLDDPCT